MRATARMLVQAMQAERPLVFLHLPKTGGQSVHHAIGAVLGGQGISPIRVMPQVQDGQTFPPHYRMHSGHLDWTDLEEIPGDPFSFTVLRDPRERLGSYFFFMREEARKMRDQKGQGALAPLHTALLQSAGDVFFSDNPAVQRPVQSHWWNATLIYLALRRLHRRPRQHDIPLEQMMRRAKRHAGLLSAIYKFGDFRPLEDDMEALIGKRPAIVSRRANPGPLAQEQSRWAALLDELDSDAQRRGIEAFVEHDLTLMGQISFRTS